MNRHTRKIALNFVTGLAIAAAAALFLLPAAQAAPGVATANVNVRSGPGSSYSVITAIPEGTRVDVQRCEDGYCYVEARRVSGWVYSRYLSADGRPVNPANPGLSFGFTIGGPDGPNFSIGIGGGRPPVITPRPPRYAEVCFYEYSRYRGDSQCFEEGDSVRDLGRRFDGFQSLRNRDGLEVQVCTRVNFHNCRTYTTSASSLGGFGDDITSLRVRR